MPLAVFLIRLFIFLPFVALEAMIKSILCIIYFPICLVLAIFYPLVKNHIAWIDKIGQYATKWKKGFYLCKIVKYWEYES